MMIRIYQIRDAEKRQAEMEKLLNRPPLSALKEVDESLYHRLFRAESMGLTDVVEMETDAGKLTLLFDSLGVSVIEFDAEKVQKADNLIRVLVIEPHRVPYESEIENTLEGEQAAVEGLIEYIRNRDGTVFVINEESKINGMEGNRRIKGDVLVGPVFIAGDAGEELCSLSDEQLEHYAKRFAKPEEISEEEVAEHCIIKFYGF